MNRGAVSKRVRALRLGIEMVMNEKGKVVAELRDEKWLSDLALLRDISHHVNYSNINLQGQQILTPDMFGAIGVM
jgi:hypothetical protein